jgi:dethiobiotin synthetase
MKNGLFITGTNTEVGKTVVARAIVRALFKRGLKVAALKPVESGAEEKDGNLVPADAEALIRASGRKFALADTCAYCFEHPVSPHLAASIAGKKIELQPILDLIGGSSANADIVVAEGAGGLLVPLSDNLLWADVVARIGFGLVVVAPNELGVINSTLLTVEAARSRGIPIVGVILNRTPAKDFGNAEAIARHGRVEILGEFPDAPGADDDELAQIAEKTINLDLMITV